MRLDPRGEVSGPTVAGVVLPDVPDPGEDSGTTVQVATDAPVALSRFSDALPRTALDPARVAELAAAYGVESSIKRLQKALDGLPD